MTAGSKVDVADRVGPRVRALREARGMSLRDLAARSSVSAPMLSQVERGETSPTLTVASRIAAGLEMPLSRLLRLDEGDHVRVVRNSGLRTTRRAGHSWQDLGTTTPGVSVSLHSLRSRGRTGGQGDAPLHSPGSRETIVVQSGRVSVLVGDETHHLGPGDSATFDADLPHHLENPGRAAATFVAVVTEGIR